MQENVTRPSLCYVRLKYDYDHEGLPFFLIFTRKGAREEAHRSAKCKATKAAFFAHLDLRLTGGEEAYERPVAESVLAGEVRGDVDGGAEVDEPAQEATRAAVILGGGVGEISSARRRRRGDHTSRGHGGHLCWTNREIANENKYLLHAALIRIPASRDYVAIKWVCI